MTRRRGVVGVIPNQVFIGCPWKTVRPKFENCIGVLSKKSPLSFILIGRDDGQEAVDLLKLIKSKIESSSHAIFDATGGNANVSLEYGYAEATGVPVALYLSSHKASRRATRDSPIIADLAGKRRNQYSRAARLQALLTEFSRDHNYTKRFESFVAGAQRRFTKIVDKRRFRALALTVIHALDNKESLRRADLIQNVLGDSPELSESTVDEMIKRLHATQLIRCEPGRYSTVTIR